MQIIEVTYNTRFHPDHGFQSMEFRIGADYQSSLPFGGTDRKCIRIEEKDTGILAEYIWVTFSDNTFIKINNHETLTYTDEQTFARVLPAAEYQPGEENNQ